MVNDVHEVISRGIFLNMKHYVPGFGISCGMKQANAQKLSIMYGALLSVSI